jgi:hypothetical protein
MVESVDTGDLKSPAFSGVSVRVRLGALGGSEVYIVCGEQFKPTVLGVFLLLPITAPQGSLVLRDLSWYSSVGRAADL